MDLPIGKKTPAVGDEYEEVISAKDQKRRKKELASQKKAANAKNKENEALASDEEKHITVEPSQAFSPAASDKGTGPTVKDPSTADKDEDDNSINSDLTDSSIPTDPIEQKAYLKAQMKAFKKIQHKWSVEIKVQEERERKSEERESALLAALANKPKPIQGSTVISLREINNLGGADKKITNKAIMDFHLLLGQHYDQRSVETEAEKIKTRNIHLPQGIRDKIRINLDAKNVELGALKKEEFLEWTNDEFFKIMLELWPNKDNITSKSRILELQKWVYNYNYKNLDPLVGACATQFITNLSEKIRELGLIDHEENDIMGYFNTSEVRDIGLQMLKHLTETIIPNLDEGSRGFKTLINDMVTHGYAAYDRKSRNHFGLFVERLSKEMFDIHKSYIKFKEYMPTVDGKNRNTTNTSHGGGDKKKNADQHDNDNKRRKTTNDNKSYENRNKKFDKEVKSNHLDPEIKKSENGTCWVCGKKHDEAVSKDDALNATNPARLEELKCKFKNHVDKNLSSNPFKDTNQGRLYMKLDNPGLQWHLKFENGKLVETKQKKNFEVSNTTSNNKTNALLFNSKKPLSTCLNTGKGQGTKIEVLEEEPVEEIYKEERINCISCNDNFSFSDYINKHLDKINALNSDLITNQSLPTVEAKITRGKIVHKFRALIDSGTNSSYISPTLIKDLRLRPTNHQPVKIRLGEGTIVTASQSVSLKDLFLFQSTVNTMDTMDMNDQLHEPENHDDENQVNPFEELVAQNKKAPCNPLPYGPFLLPVRRMQRRLAKKQQRRINAPKENNIVGVGPVDVGATILNGIETSGYDLIIGIRDIRRLKLTRVFESLFLDEEIIPLLATELTTSANVVTPSSTSLESKQVQDNIQPNRTTPVTRDSTEENIIPGAINNITSNDIARRNEWTSANTITVPKSALLDPLPPDDDYIDEYITEKSPWEDYFSQSQNKSDDIHNKTRDPIAMTLEDIKSKIKIEGTSEEQEILFKVFDKYLDRFTTTVGATAALIPPLVLKVDDKKWEEGTKVKYPRPQSAAKTYAVEKFLRQAIADGVIRPSNAPYFSQILLTPKKTPGDWRFCVDYRYLNSCTQAMRWPIPNIASLIERIGIRCNDRSAKLFATLDFTAGYHQAQLDEGSRKYTAFIIAGGLYKWCRVPMGPKGSPSYFQSEMINTVFKDQVQRTLEIYIDDLITWAKTTQELADRLDTIFEIMRKWNLTVNPSKCVFNVTSIEYVGHVISTEPTPTMSFSDNKLISVGEFELPENQKKLKGFLGLASYFRLHVRDHTLLAKPLSDMVRDYKPRQRLQWTPEQVVCFQALKDAVVGCPKLHFLMPGRPVFVQTDASDYGIGAYLFQRYTDDTGQEIETPIGFISKSLDDVQRRWSTIEKEAYAIFYTVTKWEHHLRDIHFTLQTDHRNLTFINVDLKQKVQRWKLAIQEYDFDLQYLKGELNIIADGMSRHCPNNGHGDETNSEKILNNLNNLCLARAQNYDSVLNFMTEIRDHNNGNNPTDENTNLITPREYRDYVEEHDQELNSDIQNPVIDLKPIPADKYKIISRVHNNGIPKSGKLVLVGHSGVNLTLQKVRELLLAEPDLLKAGDTWPRIRQDITNFVRKCPCCQKMALLKRPIMTRPFTTASYGLWDQVAMDSIGPLPPSSDGYKYILTIIDTFSRAVELVPLKDLTAETAANAVVTHMGRYGLPCSYLTDNGSQFVNNIITQLCDMLDINHATIHAYSSEENGIVERCNKEVQRHLRDIIYDTRVLASWPTYLPIVQRILNSAKHSSINMSPMELIYGNTLDLNRGLITPYKEPTTNLSEWVLGQIVAQQTALIVAYEKQRATDMHHIEMAYRQDQVGGKRKRSEETSYPINSYVIVEYETDPPSKLHPRLMGPMRVVSKNDRGKLPSIYTCEDLVTHKLADFHVKLIHPFFFDAKNVDPEQVALVDGQHFVVERILAHKFNPKRYKKSGDLSFHIQWQGGKTTWEPYHNTFNLADVHAYLTVNRMKSFINSKFKF